MRDQRRIAPAFDLGYTVERIGGDAMRGMVLFLALAMVACDRNAQQPSRVDVRPAAITFDGASYKSAAAKSAHGERLSRVLGCRGCHGDEMVGKLWDNDPAGYGVMWASNLTRAVPTMTDQQVRDLLTRGVHPRRPDLWVMPSEMFQHLSRPDLDAVVAYLRSLPPEGERSPDPKLGPLAISQARTGDVKPAALLVRERRSELPVDLGPQTAQGRYMATVTCAECHGPRLDGQKSPEGSTPDLVAAAGYSRAEFEQLITRGVATGGRKLHPLMQSVAKGRFAHLTPPERISLYAYLKARAERPQ